MPSVERWLSGRKRTTRNRLKGNLPWVRIPPSPFLSHFAPQPPALELRLLRQRFQLRRNQLSRTIGADEVADLLQTRSLQTPHDRAMAGTLLVIRDK